METKKREKAKNLLEVKEVQSLKVGDLLSFQTYARKGVQQKQVAKDWEQKHVFEQRNSKKHATKQSVNGNLKQVTKHECELEIVTW